VHGLPTPGAKRFDHEPGLLPSQGPPPGLGVSDRSASGFGGVAGVQGGSGQPTSQQLLYSNSARTMLLLGRLNAAAFSVDVWL
jgi:hypothetical protein